jgi:hypothetical protein
MSPSTRVCGCLGCRSDAVAVIDHPDHGQRTVCGSHIDGYDVVEWLVEREDADLEEVPADV